MMSRVLETSPTICSECRGNFSNSTLDFLESSTPMSSRENSPHGSQYEFIKHEGVISKPKDYFKAFIAAIYMMIAGFISGFVVLTVNDRLPDRETHPPLPDALLDTLPYLPDAYVWSEVIIIIFILSFVVLIIFHKHRLVIWKRYAVLMCTLFFVRSTTIYITSLPVTDVHRKCFPQSSREFTKRILEAWLIWSRGGLRIRGLETCGDYFISGHTTAMTMFNFFIAEYSPRKWYILHFVLWILQITGMATILLSRGHYSIDVFVAFYICSILFRYYHALIDLMQPRFSIQSKIIFPFISYFEDGCEVPYEFENPFSCETFDNYCRFYQTKWQEFRVHLRSCNRKMTNCLPLYRKTTK